MDNLVGLGQISWLREQMLKSEHWDIYDLNYNDFSNIFETKTKKQYNYFLMLWESKNYFKAKKLLDDWGIPHKIYGK